MRRESLCCRDKEGRYLWLGKREGKGKKVERRRGPAATSEAGREAEHRERACKRELRPKKRGEKIGGEKNPVLGRRRGRGVKGGSYS